MVRLAGVLLQLTVNLTKFLDCFGHGEARRSSILPCAINSEGLGCS